MAKKKSNGCHMTMIPISGMLFLSPLLVPEGSTPSNYSPYFTTQSSLDEAIGSGKPLGDAFGLPLNSQSPTYSVFQITPEASGQSVLQSTVAPTEEFSGQFTTSGGATQNIVANWSAWSSPTQVGELPNVGASTVTFH